jgi:hypothetical protein
MEYDLVRMGPTQFENMSVALCNSHLSPGGVSFGRGRDGGREWTFNGYLPLPPVAGVAATNASIDGGTHWDGYTVAQMKHKESFYGDPRDVTWLLNQIQTEVNRWTEKDPKKARNPKPDNLFFVTNVDLSAFPDVGGIDTVRRRMMEHQETLGLKGWAVWHGEHVCRLLDAYPGIRQTYLAHVMAGDVLALLHENLMASSPDAVECLMSYVTKELASYNSVKLTRSGTRGSLTEDLSRIGIDLPALNAAAADDDEGEQAVQPFARYFIEDSDSPRSIPKGGFCTVLVGGPGQGKSTVGQLICQSYRIALLEGGEDKLPPNVRQQLTDLRGHLKSIDVPLPTLRRWPVYVHLTEYCDYIDENPQHSLLRFLATKVSARHAGAAVGQSHLRTWMREWPWLLVLDGLDEVPNQYVRASLLQKINEFVMDVAAQNADVVMLATTRATGYGNDLAEHYPAELVLTELEPTQALAYAKLLTDSRHDNDEDLRDKVFARLQEALRDGTTSKLMGTPLQVSIMASLLEDRVRAPSTRHALFDAYYDTVYRREVNKPNSLGSALDVHEHDINHIHARAGVELQTLTESSGNLDAHLTKEALSKIAIDHLVGVQGYEPDMATRKAENLISLTTDRLVLLVEQPVGCWAYEVRSLQEFMASKYLTTGRDEEVLERLRITAPSAHWRNVWLFAAAQLFENRIHLRDSIIAILPDQDRASAAHAAVKTGSQLAFDLLDDNFAVGAPRFRERLIFQSLELLDTPFVSPRLLTLLNDASKESSVIRTHFENRLQEVLGGETAKGLPLRVILPGWAKDLVGGATGFLRRRFLLALRRSASNAMYEEMPRNVKFGTYLRADELTDLDPAALMAAKQFFDAIDNAPFIVDVVSGHVSSRNIGFKGRNLMRTLMQHDDAYGAVLGLWLREENQELPLWSWYLQTTNYSLSKVEVGSLPAPLDS